jgi:hypothetical protein
LEYQEVSGILGFFKNVYDIIRIRTSGILSNFQKISGVLGTLKF